MDSPDFYWAPLIALFTGMRISEVAAIRCTDVLSTAGINYIRIPKRKTATGVRNVPIATTLVNLGFLDYVAEVKSAGAVRIFPHRLLTNDSYSKRLSAADADLSCGLWHQAAQRSSEFPLASM